MYPFADAPADGGNSEMIITFVNSSESTGSDTISVPSGMLAGDVCVLFDMGLDNGAPPASVYPSGWNAIGSSASGAVGGVDTYGRLNLSWKQMAGGETTITGMSGAAYVTKIMLLIRKSSNAVWDTPADIAAVVQAGAISNQVVNVSARPLIVLAAAFDTVGGLSLGFSPSATAMIDDGTLFEVGYRVDNTAPANTTVSNATATGGALASFYFPLV